jgi:hypothetical protein
MVSCIPIALETDVQLYSVSDNLPEFLPKTLPVAKSHHLLMRYISRVTPYP